MTFKPFFPVIGARVDADNEPAPVLIQNEPHVIIDSYIKLHEVPERAISGASMTIPGYSESTAATPAHPSHYVVNYLTGRVHFHPSQENGPVQVTYRGLGSLVAVDEINWMWERLMDVQTFKSLNDTPADFDEHQFEYVRVNKTATGVEFVPPMVGRATSKYILAALEPGTSQEIEGSKYDVVSVYDIIPGHDAGHTVAVDDSWEIPTNAEFTTITGGEGDEAFELSGWVTTDTNPALIYHDDLWEPSGWNKVEAAISAVDLMESAGSVKFMFFINGAAHALLEGRWTPTTVDQIDTQGMTAEAVGALPAYVFNMFPGAKIGLAVQITPDPETGTSPVWFGMMDFVGKSGGGYRKTSDIDLTTDTQDEVWVATNNTDVSKDVLFVVGAGRDEIACTSDVLIFEDVAPGASVLFETPKQTTAQIFELLPKVGDQRVTVTQLNEWVQARPGAGTYNMGGCLVKDVGIGNRILAGYPEGYEVLVTFEGETVTNLGAGTYDVRMEGTDPIYVPAATGPGVYISGEGANLRIKDSYRHYSNRDNYSYYADFNIGAFVKWVSGSPLVITPNLALRWHSHSYHGGYYEACTAQLFKNYVRFRCGKTYKNIGYPEGSWVFVGMNNFRAWGQHFSSGRPIYEHKSYYCMVNGAASYIEHRQKLYQKEIHERIIMIPGGIGDASAQLGTSGGFILDHAWVTEHRTKPADTVWPYQQPFTGAQEALNGDGNPYLTYKLKNQFSAVDWPNISKLAVPAYTGMRPNESRYLIESNGHLYAFNNVTQQVEEFPLGQVTGALYAYGMTGQELQDMPDWSVDAIKSDQMNIWQISSTPDNLIDVSANPDTTMAAAIFPEVEVHAGDRLRLWKLVQNDQDFPLEWLEGSKQWRVTNTSDEQKTIRVVLAGNAVHRVGSEAVLFTDLLETPDNLDDTLPMTLVSQGGKIQKRQHVHHLMSGSL